MLILGEPTSKLDVSVQVQTLDLLVELRERLGVSYLFISHGLGVVRQFAGTVTVIRRGVQNRRDRKDSPRPRRHR